ncbi:hypothetical protein N7470_004575 [Penicillium chermesinum]|nr:hypothetical protein N7470_004575 [Penicillium chermesinum]
MDLSNRLTPATRAAPPMSSDSELSDVLDVSPRAQILDQTLSDNINDDTDYMDLGVEDDEDDEDDEEDGENEVEELTPEPTSALLVVLLALAFLLMSSARVNYRPTFDVTLAADPTHRPDRAEWNVTDQLNGY